MSIQQGWRQRGLPHKGWRLIAVYDSRDAESHGDSPRYEVCQMCGNEQVRYVHVLDHDDVAESIEVGCVCAENLCEDYSDSGPRARERRLVNRAARRNKWLKRKWRHSAKGNDFLNVEGNNVVVYQQKSGRWGYRINSTFSVASYPTEDAAKLALFDRLWPADPESAQ